MIGIMLNQILKSQQMKFGYTIIYVKNIERTIAFYESAFNLKTTFIDETKHYAQLATGDTILAFAHEALAKSNGVEFIENSPTSLPAGFEIALVCDDVNHAYEVACDKGAIAIAPPQTKPWGQTVAYVRDINGILIELCSPI
jgi:lactoylglutathione lyase